MAKRLEHRVANLESRASAPEAPTTSEPISADEAAAAYQQLMAPADDAPRATLPADPIEASRLYQQLMDGGPEGVRVKMARVGRYHPS